VWDNVEFLTFVADGSGPRELSRCRDSPQAARFGGRIPVDARFSAPVQTDPGTHPASYTMVTVLFPRLKRPGRGINHSTHLTPWLKN
jgi:hypothetical protein